MTSVLAEMTDSGVLSSWPALVIKRFCFSAFSMMGWSTLREKRVTTTKKQIKQNNPNIMENLKISWFELSK